MISLGHGHDLKYRLRKDIIAIKQKNWMGQISGQIIIRRIAGNFFLLLGTIGIATAFSLATTTINARAIGKTGVGILAIHQASALLLSGIFSFGTHQAVIRLGSKWLDSKEDLSKLVSVSFLLDQISALLGALFFIGISETIIIPGNQPGSSGYSSLPYALVVLSSGTSCALGAIRLFNRFKVFSTITVFFAFLNLVFSFIFLFFQFRIQAYLTLFAVLMCMNNVSINAYLFILLRERGLQLSLSSGLISQFSEKRRYFELLAASYMSSTVDICVRHLDIIALGRIAEASDAGVYSVAKQISSGVSKLLAPISTVMFPELSALAEKNDRQRGRQLFKTIGALLIVFSTIGGLVVYTLGDAMMTFIFGEPVPFAVAILLLTFTSVVLKIGVTIFAGFTASFGKPRVNLYAYLFSGFAYFCIVFFLVNRFFSIGAAVSQLFYSSILMAWIGTAAALLLKRPIRQV